MFKLHRHDERETIPQRIVIIHPSIGYGHHLAWMDGVGVSQAVRRMMISLYMLLCSTTNAMMTPALVVVFD